MRYLIKDHTKLKQLLWLDCLLGGFNGLAGLCFYGFFADFFGLSIQLMITISAVTLFYAVFSFMLALKKNPLANHVRILVFANWTWVLISFILIYFHIEQAALLGKIFLLLQVLVVGGLAYLEGKQIIVHQKSV